MTERYRVELSKDASKELRKLDRTTQERMMKALALLRDHPRPPSVTALKGRQGYLRIRVGNYRIVYTIKDNQLLVLVLTVGHRDSIYKSLP